MIYDWYLIFNRADFLNLGLPSRTYTQVLEGVGQKDILATSGELCGMLYEGVFLPVGLNSKNPFEFEDHAVYVDENEDVWLGILVPEEEE